MSSIKKLFLILLITLNVSAENISKSEIEK